MNMLIAQGGLGKKQLLAVASRGQFPSLASSLPPSLLLRRGLTTGSHCVSQVGL